MRNIFDQYTQPENRLTHALVTCLSEDSKLLNKFVSWVTGKRPPNKNLEIIEQRLPGEPEITEDESERRGLPDAWIHDNDRWSLLIESKVSATLKNDQLRRHYNTAIRRGFDAVTVVAIDVIEPRRKLIDEAIFKSWSEIYEWLYKNSEQSEWPVKTLRYMEIAEAKWTSEGYLKEGTLTKFSGIPFNNENPYNYPEAKRLLKLMMEDLRKRKDLVSQVKADQKGTGRGMITGKKTPAVWDFIPLKGSSGESNFTKYPHLTLAIEQNYVLVIVTIPHNIKTEFRRNIIELGFDGFQKLMKLVNRNLTSSLRKAKGSVPTVIVVQRHYPTQSAPAIVDAKLQYDLRTAFKEGRAKKPVKFQPQWLETTYDVLTNKKSNLQVAVGAIFPYQTCTVQQTPQILDYIEKTWLSCKPLIDVLLTGKYKG